jgi:uncharacterized membrane protein YGL010W
MASMAVTGKETPMLTLKQYLIEYGKTHRNPTNQLIHFICVPAIFISSLGLGWLLNLNLLGVDAPWARWINAATVGGALILLFFYARMGWRASVLMMAWFAISVALILAVEASPAPLWLVAAGVWIAAWLVQLVGHNIEGAKPSFIDDLVFLLIGPLFVMEELGLSPLAESDGTLHA